MVSGTDNSYARMEGFSNFSQLTNPDWYHPLPHDWSLVITDVRGSTTAIKQDRYKQVNGVGVASIVALINAVKPLKVPYTFGGDGATACFPCVLLNRVKPALVAARRMAREQFGLELRIGVIGISEIRAGGFDIRVGKFASHAFYHQAMFIGDGLGYAEKMIKAAASDNPYHIEEGISSDNSIFDGFECRWNEIPSPREETIALIVRAKEENPDFREPVYSEVLDQISKIYGRASEHHPLRETQLSLTGSTRLLSVEARIRTAFQSRWKRLKYLFRLHILKFVGIWFMARGVRTDATNWGDYKQNLIINTDYRKFDDLLRMVISGSKAQRRELRTFLEAFRDNGKIVFGIQAAPTALITCIVTDYDKDHVHFLDCANGGYAVAAMEMKKQLGTDNYTGSDLG